MNTQLAPFYNKNVMLEDIDNSKNKLAIEEEVSMTEDPIKQLNHKLTHLQC